MGYRHYVLRDLSRTVTLFDRLEAALTQLREERGLDFHYAFYRDLAENLGEHVYMETRDQALLHIVEDFKTPVRYIQVGAGDSATINIIAAALKGTLDLVPLSELQECTRRELNSNPSVLIRLALGAGGQADPLTLEILGLGLRDGDHEVRRVAAEAASLTRWPELVPLLTPLVNDPVPAVRDIAALALQACGRRISSSDDQAKP